MVSTSINFSGALNVIYSNLIFHTRMFVFCKVLEMRDIKYSTCINIIYNLSRHFVFRMFTQVYKIYSSSFDEFEKVFHIKQTYRRMQTFLIKITLEKNAYSLLRIDG